MKETTMIAPDEATEFRTWIKKHDNHLRMEGYAPDEVAMMAVRCGFSIEVACEGVTNQVVQIKRLLNFWESPLSGQWLDLKAYEMGFDQ